MKMDEINVGDFVIIRSLKEIRSIFPRESISGGLHFLCPESPTGGNISFCVERAPYCGFACEVIKIGGDKKSFMVRRPFSLPEAGIANIDFYLDPRMVVPVKRDAEVGYVSDEDFESLF